MRFYCKGIDIIVAFHTDEQPVDPVKYGYGVYIVVVPNGSPPTFDPVTLKWTPFPQFTPEVIAASVKDECGRRITTEVNDAQQRNITAYVTSIQQDFINGATITQPQNDDIATATAIYQWIGRPNGMQGASDSLIAAGDTEWWLDGKWPPWNSTWDAFVARF